ncbi:solute carrier family 22 member 21 [Elysia marginata]|uniref:Solute carrier family 22 member 21 n=1 Tax=Elysia marginata TaxID=1093978 RepID=A0AAV4ICP3_9GAST|nr:solute carrier family 22 member 21 [Elysia marginata]
MATIEEIYDAIGGFHLFQALLVVWVYGIKAVIACSTLIMAFGGFKPDYACMVNSLTNQTSLKYVNDAQLRHYAETGVNNLTFLNVCDINGTKCEEFRFFGPRRTVISEWHLVCDLRWMKPTIISVQFCGVLIGAILGGQSGDYFGRKKTLYGSYLIHTLLNAASAFSQSWHMFTVLRFFIGMMIGSILVIIVPYPTEFFPLRWRHTVPGIPMWPLGMLCFSGAAWLLEDWSHLHLAIAVVGIPGLLGYFYVPESARWLATRGRLDEAYAALEKMAAVNRKKLPPAAMETIKEIARMESERKKGKRYSYIDIFKTKTSIKLTLIFAFHWITMSLIVYGLNFAVTSFAGNLYLNIFLMNIVLVPAHLISFLLIDRCLLNISSLLLTTSPDLQGILINASCLTSKLALAAVWSASQTWVTESYPTVMRSLGYGFANMASRVGAIAAPFVINLDEMPLLAFILMGSLTLICTVLTYFIPETRNKAMTETVGEHEMFDSRSKQDNFNGQNGGEKPRKLGLQKGGFDASLNNSNTISANQKP